MTDYAPYEPNNRLWGLYQTGFLIRDYRGIYTAKGLIWVIMKL